MFFPAMSYQSRRRNKLKEKQNRIHKKYFEIEEKIKWVIGLK